MQILYGLRFWKYIVQEQFSQHLETAGLPNNNEPLYFSGL